MAARDVSAEILAYLARRQAAGYEECSPYSITAGVRVPRPTVNRHLASLVESGALRRLHGGPATRYALAPRAQGAASSAVCGEAAAECASL